MRICARQLLTVQPMYAEPFIEIFAQVFRLFPFNKFRHDGLLILSCQATAAATLSTVTLSCSSFEKEAIFHFDICITGLLYRNISLIIRVFPGNGD